MKRYTPEELHAVLAEHKKWVLNEGGSRAVLSGADLRGAGLSGADLSGADLRRADLSGADLRRADLSGAGLSGADLSGADLRGADLRRADLSGADLRGAVLRDIKIKKATVFTGLYRYLVMPVIAEDGTEWVRLGCYFRTVADWEANFWNNPSEFPNDGDTASKERRMAYETAKVWLAIHREYPPAGGEGSDGPSDDPPKE